MSAVHHEIASVFATNQPSSLDALINKHRELLQRENNWGLAKQVQRSLYKKIIQRLTQTFLTLSLSDMALRVQLASVSEAEELVLTMVTRNSNNILPVKLTKKNMCHTQIEEGEIYASISQKDGMVLFHDNPDKYDNTSTVERLQKEVRGFSPIVTRPPRTQFTLNNGATSTLHSQVNYCMELDVQVQRMEEEICVNPQYVKKSCGVLDDDESRSLQPSSVKVPSFSM